MGSPVNSAPGAADQTDQLYHDRVNAMNPKIITYNFLTGTNKYTKWYPKNINKTLRQGGPDTPQYIYVFPGSKLSFPLSGTGTYHPVPNLVTPPHSPKSTQPDLTWPDPTRPDLTSTCFLGLSWAFHSLSSVWYWSSSSLIFWVSCSINILRFSPWGIK